MLSDIVFAIGEMQEVLVGKSSIYPPSPGIIMLGEIPAGQNHIRIDIHTRAIFDAAKIRNIFDTFKILRILSD